MNTDNPKSVNIQQVNQGVTGKTCQKEQGVDLGEKTPHYDSRRG